ncbi:MAG: hypothetical protein ACK5PB_23100 [Pirellula sp.]
MKNQNFGNIDDYRKYGILRLLGGAGDIRIGVCWMLTAADNFPDASKTEYLQDTLENAFRPFDPLLYDYLKRLIHKHETEITSRNVKHLDANLLPYSAFWAEELSESMDKRNKYFGEMWFKFEQEEVDLIYFDPDDGLGSYAERASSIRSCDTLSSKKLFREDVRETLEKGFSLLIRQPIKRLHRENYVATLGLELAKMTNSAVTYSFWTFNEAFLLIPHPNKLDKLKQAVERVANSPWVAKCRGRKRRKFAARRIQGFQQVNIKEHVASS